MTFPITGNQVEINSKNFTGNMVLKYSVVYKYF